MRHTLCLGVECVFVSACVLASFPQELYISVLVADVFLVSQVQQFRVFCLVGYSSFAVRADQCVFCRPTQGDDPVRLVREEADNQFELRPFTQGRVKSVTGDPRCGQREHAPVPVFQVVGDQDVVVDARVEPVPAGIEPRAPGAVCCPVRGRRGRVVFGSDGAGGRRGEGLVEDEFGQVQIVTDFILEKPFHLLSPQVRSAVAVVQVEFDFHFDGWFPPAAADELAELAVQGGEAQDERDVDCPPRQGRDRRRDLRW